MPVELVIFDCDGVLVDSEAINSAVLAGAIADLGLPGTTAEDVRGRYQGLMLRDIGRDLATRLGRPLPDGFWEEFDRARRAAFETSLRPIDGAAETVAAVQALGLRTCVASQARLQKTHFTLGLTGLRRFFADCELFSADQVARGKPHPDLFLYAARQMGAEPARCLVVEDSPTGIAAAIAARMRVVAYAERGAVPTAATAPPAPPDPAIPVIERLPALLEIIGAPPAPTSGSRTTLC